MEKFNKKRVEIAAESVEGQPEDSFELINKYGTYEIQPTCESENKYPEIAQGRPRGRKSGDRYTGIKPDRSGNKFTAEIKQNNNEKT